MGIIDFLALVWSFCSLYTIYVFARSWIVSFFSKFTPSRLGFLHKERKWYQGKWCLITGGTGGIGFNCACVMAENGMNVAIAIRDLKKGMSAAKKIRKHALMKGSKVEVACLPCDLLSFESVVRCAEHVKQSIPISVLINCAGVMKFSYEKSQNNQDAQYQTTYLSHFLLTWLVWDTLELNGPSRVVWVSSDLHHLANTPMPPRDPQLWYSGMEMYSISKLAVVMSVHEWQRKFVERESDAKVAICAVDPGGVNTSIWRDLPFFVRLILNVAAPFLIKSPSKGAESTLYAALSAEGASKSGKYFSSECTEIKSSGASYDIEMERELWMYTTNLLKPYMLYEKRTAGGAGV